jgi:hypothetical protein
VRWEFRDIFLTIINDDHGKNEYQSVLTQSTVSDDDDEDDDYDDEQVEEDGWSASCVEDSNSRVHPTREHRRHHPHDQQQQRRRPSKLVMAMAWMTPDEKRQLHLHPEVIHVDATAATNKEKRPLLTFHSARD